MLYNGPMYDLVIVGGGPAGVAAGVYAARKKIKTAVVAESFGGQSIVSASVENWIGEKSISGYDLAKKLEEHLKSQEEIDILESERVETVAKTDSGFSVKTKSGKVLETKTVLVATGGRHRRLNVPGEAKFEGRGIVFCATCDAPLFRGKTVAVVGGGNAGLEAVVDLFPYAEKIYLIVRADKVKGDPVTFEEVRQSPKVEIIYNAETQEVLGDAMVSGLRYKDTVSGEIRDLSLQGVFVEVGVVPNSEIVKDLVQIDDRGQVVVDPRTNLTSVPGVWAVGDVANTLYNQNNIASGDAIRALLNISDWLKINK